MKALLVAIWCISALSGRAISQTPARGDSIHAAKTLFTWRDPLLAGGFIALTVGLLPVDGTIQRHLQDSTTQANHFLKNASRTVEYVGDPGALVVGVGMYAIGRVANLRRVEDLGLHLSEAVVASGIVTALAKDVAGRARPYVSGDTSPHDFSWLRGFRGGGGYRSFPSGHTTAAFAGAAVVTSESQLWSPHAVWFVAPLAYGTASLVSLSRMYNNAHWASDVVLGAAVGTFSGIKVVRYTHGHSNNLIDRWLLGTTVVGLPDGRFAVGWSSSTRGAQAGRTLVK